MYLMPCLSELHILIRLMITGVDIANSCLAYAIGSCAETNNHGDINK